MPVTCAEMKRIEDEAFARGATAEGLMEQAGEGIFRVAQEFVPGPARCIVFCGKGHNGGDALVVARHLARAGSVIDVRLTCPEAGLAPLTAKMLAALPPQDSVRERPLGTTLVLDGLLGIGASGAPRGEIAAAIREINSFRETGAQIVAIDIPSGLDGDTGIPAGDCVEADLTVTVGAVKRGLVADTATNAVGRLALVPLAGLEVAAGRWQLSTAAGLRGGLPRRRFDVHKGDFGRIGILAGSVGFSGAARLCSAAAVRAGGGLVTLYARPDVHETLTATCVPEVMVKRVNRLREALDDRMDVFAIGPGLGTTAAEDVMAVVREAVQPVVVDADALNVLARDPSALRHCKGPRLLTPHPGEMERLFPQAGRSRSEWLDAFLAAYPVNLLLKGARTLLGSPDGSRAINSTGNPGMASGGMGDVLTGVCAALAGQLTGPGSLYRAGVLGAWLCGRAAETEAIFQRSSAPIAASSVVGHLPFAFASLRNGIA